ncbi:STAS domain-containing protein [Rhodobacteraceae bacterium NNCM2]|nr:STAS domain-containing protein [Coraliihabitans acroporae]
MTSTDGDACKIVLVAGRVDHTNAAVFGAELEKATGELDGKSGMVVDLSGLEFITSAGLRGLIIAQKKLSGSGARLAISGLSGTVADVFRISRFDTLFPVADTADAASALVSD